MNADHDQSAKSHGADDAKLEAKSVGQPRERGMPLASDSVAPATRPLRVIPAIVLVALLWGIKLLLPLFFDVSMPLFMLTAFGPIVIALVILGWWLFASRASAWEKVIVFVSFLAALVIANMFYDKSVQGFGLIMMVIPVAITVFSAAIVVLRNQTSRTRIVGTILTCAAAFGYFAALRNDGISGNMKADMRWRWQPSSEEDYLATRKSGERKNVPAESTDFNVNQPPEWPGFRGPHRDGKVLNVKLKTDWNANPPKQIWRHRIGPGWSSFAVWGNRIFTQEQRGDVEAFVCYDARNGEEIWSHESLGRFWEAVGGAGPRATPTIHDGKVYALGAKGAVFCFEPATGKVIWQRDLQVDTGNSPPMWGFSSSPLIVNDTVILLSGAPNDSSRATSRVEKGVIGYDAKTGEVLWAVPSGDHSYSSGQLYSVEDHPQALVHSNLGLYAIDPANGSVNWQHDWKADGYTVVQPLFLPDQRILIGAPAGLGVRLLRVVADEKTHIAHCEEIWSSRDMKPYFNDYVEHNGYLYGFDNDIFAAINLADGKRAWKKGRYGSGQVILLPDADQLLVISETGDIVLLQADPKKSVELARFKALEGKTWNHPVLVANRLYVRNAEEVACYEMAVEE